jgi:amino acid adenylation domain-containing protein
MSEQAPRPTDAAAARQALLRRWQDSATTEPTAASIPRRPPADTAPLSFAQRRLWLLEQLAPGTLAYQMYGAFHVTGALDAGALDAALQALVQRHEILRTTFAPGDPEPVQRIAPALHVPLERGDLQALPAADRLPEAVRQLTASVQRPFSLVEGPLLRARLLTLAPEEHAVLLAMHHITSDGWSLGVLLHELASLYTARVTGQPASLAPLPLQYADYAAWQRQCLQGDVLQQELAFWTARLAGAPGVLELPTDHPRPAVQRFQGARHGFHLPAALVGALKALGQGEGATLYMVLLAAFQALLHRYTGQTDLLIGSPIAHRTRPETAGTLGPFASTLVLRADLSGNPRVRELLRRVREHCLGAFAHQDMPFERLVEELRPPRDLGRNPLFQVMLVLQNTPPAALTLGQATTRVLPLALPAAMLDLSLELVEQPDGLAASFEYSTDLFDAATIARTAGHLRTLLEAMAAQPDARLGELPLLTAPERHQVLAGWNATHHDVPLDEPLHHLLSRQAARTPHAIAVTCEGQHLTYAELEHQAHRLAYRLRALGVGAESRVGLCLERSLELVIALVATLQAGAAYVPLDPSYPRDRLAFMAADAQLHQLLFHAPTAAQVASLPAPLLQVDALDDDISGAPAVSLDRGPGGDHLAYVIYTSGSTGRPKGAMNTHRAIVNRLRWMQQAFPLGPDDAVLQKTPFGFDVSVWELFWPLMTGARLVMARPGGHQDSGYLASLIAAERITTLHFVPSMLQLFLDEPALPAACASLRRVICSGEALPLELARRFHERLDAPLFNLYGPTEAAVDVSWWACEREPERPCVPIGVPIANLQLFILDRWLQPVPAGIPGELFIGGVGLARGYLGRPGLTAERFLPHPFAPAAAPGQRLYRTGDIARFLADGAIEYLGRTDHQVKLRGFRIELGEIEAALAALPAVREALVVLRREPSGDGRLVAYLVAEPAGSLEPAELRAHLRQSLPEHMVPAAFVVLERFPLSPNGKLDRAALPPPTQPAAAATLPESSLEQAIAAAWRDVLGVPVVGLHDNFFDLGGHSLLLARVYSALRPTLGPDVPLLELYRYPTVHSLAAYLDHRQTPPEPHDPDPGLRRAERQRAALARQVARRKREP